jgi:hypothetical protein
MWKMRTTHSLHTHTHTHTFSLSHTPHTHLTNTYVPFTLRFRYSWQNLGLAKWLKRRKKTFSSKLCANENRSIVLTSILQKITLPNLSRYQHLSESPLLKVFDAYLKKLYHHFLKTFEGSSEFYNDVKVTTLGLCHYRELTQTGTLLKIIFLK